MALSLVRFVLAACTVTALEATLEHHTFNKEVTIRRGAEDLSTPLHPSARKKAASPAVLNTGGSTYGHGMAMAMAMARAIPWPLPWLGHAVAMLAMAHGAPQPGCPLPANAKWCSVTVGRHFSMAVYNNDDIVSKSICHIGSWELQLEDVADMGKPGHALDIGANMGFYSFVLAAAGWNVTAFEPMVANHALIEATLCKNPEFKPKVTLHKVGLGARADHCIVVSDDLNLGDGITKCGADVQKFERDGQTNYHQRATMDIRRLDDLLEQQKVKSIDFVKMDVEGFECNVMAGGQSLLTKFRPRMIQTEVWPHMQGCLPHDYLTSFANASYTVAEDRVCGHPDDLSNPKASVDRYMCRKTGASLLQNVQGLEQTERSIVWLRRN